MDTSHIPAPEIFAAIYSVYYFTSSHESIVYSSISYIVFAICIVCAIYRVNRNSMISDLFAVKSTIFITGAILIQIAWDSPYAQIVVLGFAVLYIVTFYRQSKKIETQNHKF